MKRPNNIASILIGGVLGFIPAIWISNAMPEGLRAATGLGGLAVGPVVMLVRGSKKWAAYISEKQQEWEQAKDAVRLNPTDSMLREVALKAGRTYYSCMNEALPEGATTPEQEAYIANDLKVLIG
jgi:hypothetical protein